MGNSGKGNVSTSIANFFFIAGPRGIQPGYSRRDANLLHANDWNHCNFMGGLVASFVHPIYCNGTCACRLRRNKADNFSFHVRLIVKRSNVTKIRRHPFIQPSSRANTSMFEFTTCFWGIVAPPKLQILTSETVFFCFLFFSPLRFLNIIEELERALGRSKFPVWNAGLYNPL